MVESYLMFEILATLMGIIQGALVWFNKRSNWIFYCLQYIFISLFSIRSKLYGDFGNSIAYIIVGIVGFVLWNKKSQHANIKWCSKKERAIYIIITVIFTLVTYYVLKSTNDILPLFDSMTTVTGYIATYYMLTKKVDAWILWLINDILYIIEYYMLPERAWYLITLNLIWVVMAIGSLITWNKLSRKFK